MVQASPIKQKNTQKKFLALPPCDNELAPEGVVLGEFSILIDSKPVEQAG